MNKPNRAIKLAVVISSLQLLLLLIFATPKSYNFATYDGGRGSQTIISPIFSVKPHADGVSFLFAGLNISVLLCELFGATAVGLIIWVFASMGSRREDSSDESRPSADLDNPSLNNPPSHPIPRLTQQLEADDEPYDAQAKEFIDNPLIKLGLMKPLPDCDQYPDATGPFGECITNPIPVNGQTGEITYLSRLRSKSGVGFMWHRLGSNESRPYPLPIDIFELVAIDASEWRTLYFGIYHKRRSIKAPNGLHLVPWSQMTEIERVMSKTGFPGHNQKVDNFPFGLPAIIENSKVLGQISPDMGHTMAQTIQKWLNENKGKWGSAYRQSIKT